MTSHSEKVPGLYLGSIWKWDGPEALTIKMVRKILKGSSARGILVKELLTPEQAYSEKHGMRKDL